MRFNKCFIFVLLFITPQIPVAVNNCYICASQSPGNTYAMGTYILTVNERTRSGKNLVAYLSTLKGAVTIEHQPNEETIAAIEDVKAGRITRTKNKADFFDKLNS